MPIAAITSALRRLVSAKPLRAAANRVAARRRPAGELLGEQRQADEHDRAGERRDADPNVKGKADQRDRSESTADRTARSGPGWTGTP